MRGASSPQRRRLLCTLLALGLASPVMADWATTTPQALAQSSAVVVTGEYLGQQNQVQLPGGGPPINIGVLRVEQWFKGAQAQALLLVVSALPRANGAVSSVDVPLQAGQRGLWYLRAQGQGLYKIDRPDRFVPMDAATAQIKLLQAR